MRYVDMCVFLKIGCLESRAVGPFLPGHCLPLTINLSIPHEWETSRLGEDQLPYIVLNFLAFFYAMTLF